MRICSGAGCLRAIPESKTVRFCAECQAERAPKQQDVEIREHTLSDRERYAFLYSGSRWQRVQRIALTRCPLCKRCESAISELVDHAVPAGVAVAQAQASGRWALDKWAGFYLLSNLQGLCRGCHYLKTLEDKAHVGAWPSVVDAEDRAPTKRWTF